MDGDPDPTKIRNEKRRKQAECQHSSDSCLQMPRDRLLLLAAMLSHYDQLSPSNHEPKRNLPLWCFCQVFVTAVRRVARAMVGEISDLQSTVRYEDENNNRQQILLTWALQELVLRHGPQLDTRIFKRARCFPQRTRLITTSWFPQHALFVCNLLA